MYEQYKAIVALAELVKNPKALQDAADTMSEAISLNEAEIAKRNEYNDLINQGNQLQISLVKQKAEIDALNSEYDANTEKLAVDKATFEEECRAKNLAIDVREAKLIERESALNTKEGNLNQREAAIDVREAAASAKESSLNAREFDVLEREKKIEAILNAGK